MTKQKKPKAGDVVGWVLIDKDGDSSGLYMSRKSAREEQKWFNREGGYAPYVIGKVIKP